MRLLKTFFKSLRCENVHGQDAQQTFRQFAQTLMAMKSRRKPPQLRKVAGH